MRTKRALSLSDARRIIDAARAEAEQRKWNVSIAVVDDGGFLLALERLDGAGPQTPEIATRKAWTAAMVRLPTKTVGVSGVASHEDEQVSRAGIAALG